MGYGTVYKITTNGAFTLLVSFDGASMGGYPVGGLVQGTDGNFYGTTADLRYLSVDGTTGNSVGNGTIFRVTPAGSYTKLHSFTGGPGGLELLAGLLQASDGMGPKGPEPDLTRLLSGHPANANFPPPPKLAPGSWFAVVGSFTAWSGPWGISYSANLTPDTNTGLGIWTEETFMRTVRTGKHFGVARDILLPMPWQNLAAMTDEDLKAIYAYLRTIPPVHNVVSAPVPPGATANFE